MCNVPPFVCHAAGATPGAQAAPSAGLSAEEMQAAMRSVEDETDAAAAAALEQENAAELAEFTLEPASQVSFTTSKTCCGVARGVKLEQGAEYIDFSNVYKPGCALVCVSASLCYSTISHCESIGLLVNPVQCIKMCRACLVIFPL